MVWIKPPPMYVVPVRSVDSAVTILWKFWNSVDETEPLSCRVRALFCGFFVVSNCVLPLWSCHVPSNCSWYIVALHQYIISSVVFARNIVLMQLLSLVAIASMIRLAARFVSSRARFVSSRATKASFSEMKSCVAVSNWNCTFLNHLRRWRIARQNIGNHSIV